MTETDDAIEAAAVETGLDARLLRRIAEVESSGNPAAHTAGSKYFGLFQLSQAEFLEFGGGDIFSAVDNAKAGARKIKKDGDRWAVKHSAAATSFDLYMMHQQGWSGYHALLAALDQPAWSAIRSFYDTDERAQLAIRGNLPAGALPGEPTAKEFLDFWRARLALDSAPASTDPAWLTVARRELGVKEGPGSVDNAKVVAYYKDAGHPEITHDETAWCAAFVGAVLKRSGLAPSGSLMARSYLKWGTKLDVPRLGCVVVFWRESPDSSSGHVGFYVGTAANGDINLLGGNQSDQVSIAVQPKSRVLGYRWPQQSQTQTQPRVINMADRFKDIIDGFAPLVPILARVIAGPAGGVAAAVLVDAIDKSGKRTEGEQADETLKRLGVGDALPILRAAETALEAIGVLTVPPVASGAPAPLPTAVQPVSEAAPAPVAEQPTPLAPALTVLDSLLGLTGYKTYIVLFVAGLVNVLAGLHVAPGLLTPETLTAINTALAALGGATLINKVERYANLATGLLRKN